MRTVIITADFKSLKLDKTYPFGPESLCKLAGTASDGNSGLKIIEETKPDIVVLDMQIPGLEGLEVLHRIRLSNLMVKVVILTENVSFPFLQKAISMGIDACLQKPVSRDEFLRIMDQVQLKVKMTRSLLRQHTLDDTLMAGMTGTLKVTEDMQEDLFENYGFVIDEPLCTMMLFLGEQFESCHRQVREWLMKARVQATDQYYGHIMEIETRKMFILVLYGMKDQEKVRHYFEESVVPKLARKICPEIICAWRKIQDLSRMSVLLEELEKQLDWNLMFGSGVLITYEKIENLRVVPFPYPKEVANRAKQALIDRRPMVFGDCVREFGNQCRIQLHRPKEVKEACIRFCIGILKVARNYGYEPEATDQDILKTIANAVSWEEIDRGLEQMFRRLLRHRSVQNTSSNAMVQKAWKIVHEEYQTDITLEGLARRLYVSEEYLSAQFKKETGKTFRETVRDLRIEKAKELLIHTKWKVGEIAQMVGYSDPKYMSRVFREAAGVGPAEYRKIY